MNENDFLADRFETDRAHLRAVAYRMLGSLSEADDAVQEAWLRLNRSDTSDVENLSGWLTTVVGRVCLDMLRSRRSRQEEPISEKIPDPILSNPAGIDPEQQALVADSVGLALLIVLQTLAPAERLAFVLHDMFALSFDEIAPIVDRTPAAARQLASRARRRVQGAAPVPDSDLGRQRHVVDAFLTAARGGDFDALLAVLDPDVVLHSDAGADPNGPLTRIRSAATVARQALMFSRLAESANPALVNGAAGFVAMRNGHPLSVMAFTIVNGKIVEIDTLTDPARLAALDLTVLDD